MGRMRKLGFSLVELLVVIGILAILLALLFPAVSAVREAAWRTSTESRISQISTAIEAYYSEFRTYPGPISNAAWETTGCQIAGLGGTYPSGLFIADNVAQASATGTENLVLSLMGGLEPATSGRYPFRFNKNLLTQGPASLGSTPKKHAAYISDTAWLSNGLFVDEAGRRCMDTSIPEFVDAFREPLPIIYARANAGVSGIAYQNGSPRKAYNIDQIRRYTMTQAIPHTTGGASPPAGQCIGLPPGTYHGLRHVGDASDPKDAYYGNALSGVEYLENPNIPGSARNKDGYILISAGKDRIYGTSDDVTSFGSVKP